MLGSVRVGYNICQNWQQVGNGHTLCKLGEEEGNQVYCSVRLNKVEAHTCYIECASMTAHTYSLTRFQGRWHEHTQQKHAYKFLSGKTGYLM